MTKTMKYLSIASIVLAGAMILGCSQEDLPNLQPETPSGNVVIRTATISMEGEEPTRALTEHGVKTFKAGDKIAVVNDPVCAVVCFCKGAVPRAEAGLSFFKKRLLRF